MGSVSWLIISEEDTELLNVLVRSDGGEGLMACKLDISEDHVQAFSA